MIYWVCLIMSPGKCRTPADEIVEQSAVLPITDQTTMMLLTLCTTKSTNTSTNSPKVSGCVWKWCKYHGILWYIAIRADKPWNFGLGNFQTSPASIRFTVVRVSSSHSSLLGLYPTKALWAPAMARAEWPFEPWNPAQPIGKSTPEWSWKLTY